MDGAEKAEEKKAKSDKKDQVKVGDEPPTGYIHVRARRGQATDSHSLAERVLKKIQSLSFTGNIWPPIISVCPFYPQKNMKFHLTYPNFQLCLMIVTFFLFQVRREKISERMKMLQRLVPGCDKVEPSSLSFLVSLTLIWTCMYYVFRNSVIF